MNPLFSAKCTCSFSPLLQAAQQGGALFLQDTRTYVYNCDFQSNQASTGGAVTATTTGLYIKNSDGPVLSLLFSKLNDNTVCLLAARTAEVKILQGIIAHPRRLEPCLKANQHTGLCVCAVLAQQ